jgi:hypothetical protein
MLAAEEHIIPMRLLRLRGVAAGEELGVDDPGLRAADPHHLVGLGGDRREVRVDHLDLGGVRDRQAEEFQPGGGLEGEEFLQGGVERLAHQRGPSAR